jgi:hypothetical protein
MWGPRAEILLMNAFTIPMVVGIGLYCVHRVTQTQVTGSIWYAWWVPMIAGAIPGLGAAADVLIRRQYQVLQRLGDPSAPEVYWMSQVLMGLGHFVAVISALLAVIWAEWLVWEYYKAHSVYQQRYLWLTSSYVVIASILWVVAATYKHHLK